MFLLSSDEREAVQKKTFTKWVNSILSRVGCRISDLYLDLRDGRMLIKLLEVLSGERLVRRHTLHFSIVLYFLWSSHYPFYFLKVYHSIATFSIYCFCFSVLFLSLAKTHKRQNAYSLFGERGQGSAVPQRAEGPPGEHGFSRHRRRQPSPHPWPHLDYHPSFPGKLKPWRMLSSKPKDGKTRLV